MSVVAPIAEPEMEKPQSTPSSLNPSDLTPDFSKLEDAPEWFQKRAQTAWEDFQTLPMPGNRDESWRYSQSKHLALDGLRLAPEPTEEEKQEAIARSRGLEQVSARLIFLNDRLIFSDTAGLANGVAVIPFAEALRTHGDVLQQYLMRRKADFESSKFAALHLAHVQAGAVILAPKNAVLKAPIEIFHWVTGANSLVFPHTLIVAGDHAEVTVLDHHASLKDEVAQSIAVADFVAGNGSHVTYVNSQELSDSAGALHISSTTVARDAQVKALQLQLGASFARSESVSDLIGEGGRSDMLGVSLPFGSQIVDMRTLQNHMAPRTYSDLLYKNALYDKSKTVFSGLINVSEGAHYTDAYQKCRNLINSPDSEAVSMPGLEINADQVKCSHGATSAPINADELFYLKARGIPDQESRQLIAIGFVEDVISRLGQEELIASLNQRIEDKFARQVAA
ncbi:MAG: Fe-S cluster assembly protein SufD [Verrucomicrobium sp.]|nr:Fe-S cluster assembly protein SufD [Verrucomicrobium sp.]